MKRRTFVKSLGLGLGSCALPGCRPRNISPSSSSPPNFLVLVTDDQRADALGCAGNPFIHTPHMDCLASGGVLFERAFVTTPICAASRASIFTGLYERSHGYTFTKPPLSRALTDLSYPVLLRQNGYRTGFIGKFGVKVEDGVEEEMFHSVRKTGFPYFKETEHGRRHLTEIHGDLAVEFLRGCSQVQPFCLSLSFWAPHADDGAPEQYFWPPACDGLYEDIVFPTPETADPVFFEALPDFLKKTMNRIRWHWRFDTPEKFQSMVKGYYRMITGVDKVIGKLVRELRDLDLFENTVIVLIGDNGYFLGERGFAGKWLMHDLSTRVPFIICDPRGDQNRTGRIRRDMVLNIDLAPTLLDLAGLPVPETMQGSSLRPILSGLQPEWRDQVFTEHLWDHPEIPRTEGLRTDRWKYIRYFDFPEFEELYDLDTDPGEAENLAGNPAHKTILQEMRERCRRQASSAGMLSFAPRPR
jgi:arylsulfatase A-like enzyme